MSQKAPTKQQKIERLHLALETGDLKQLQKWFESGELFIGTQYNYTTKNNNVLIHAAKYGHLNVIKWLIEECEQKIRVVVNPRNPKPCIWDALTFAADDRHYEAVKWMLLHIDDPEYDVARLLNTPSKYGELDFIKWLVNDSGYKVNKSEEYGWALQEAAKYGRFETLKWYLDESELTLNTTVNYSELLLSAIDGKQFEIVKYLLEEFEQQIDVAIYSNSAIINAAHDNSVEIVKYLIEKSKQVIDCRDCDQWELTDNKAHRSYHFYQFFEINGWSDECKNYLLTVKRIQEANGIENWLSGGIFVMESQCKEKWKL